MLKPLGNRVLIKRSEYNKMSSGGIEIPDNFTDKPLRGHVVSFGPGERLQNGQLKPMSVSEGNLVTFMKENIEEIKIDDDEFIIMSEDNIVAILEESD